MISKKFKCIYVDVPKTGSTSMRAIFGQGKFHSSILKIKSQVTPEVFNEYFKFGFVRNPWDREVSRYYYILGSKAHPFNRRWHELGSFAATVEHGQRMKPQLGFFTDEDGQMICDFIGRFENLQNDFDTVCDNIGMSQFTLEHRNKTKRRRHYTEYYDDNLRDILAEKYARDIDYFDYKFGE